jgi:hypothetical protein
VFTGNKTRAKKSMRVATIFTGVAACTAGVTQVANAQEVAHADVRPTAHNAGGTVRPAGRLSGNIEYSWGCVDPNWFTAWVHLGSPDAVEDPVCFGNKGIYGSPPGTGLVSQCGGTNHGFLEGAKAGRSVSTNYGPGNTFRYLGWSHWYDIGIWSWTGNDTCGIGA